MKKLLLLLFLGIFLISFVSAPEIDNFKYERDVTFDGREILGNALLERYKPIEIRNLFGLGSTLFEGYLSQHDNYCGEVCTSTLQIKLHQDGVLIDEVMFKTLKDDGTWIEQPVRDYEFYIKTGEIEYSVNDFETVCEIPQILGNGTEVNTCNRVRAGSHLEIRKEWRVYDLGEEVLEGEYEIKLKAQKKSSRTVDYIIKTNGEWLESMAVWGSSGLIDDLFSYYSLNGTSGPVLDENGHTNGTNVGAIRGVQGIINNSFNFSGGQHINTSNSTWNFGVNDDLTLSGWVNTTSSGTIMDVWGVVFGAAAAIEFGLGNSDQAEFVLGSGIGEIVTITGTTNISDGDWHFIVGVRNTTSDRILLYVDGVLEANETDLSNNLTTNIPWFIGDANGPASHPFFGRIDEVGIWNKSISSFQISRLYNLGMGISYPFSEATVTLNSPANNITSPQAKVQFSATATITSGANLTNMSLYTNRSGTWQITNTTILAGVSTNTQLWNVTFTEGSYIWGVEGCDTDGDCGFSNINRTLHFDLTPPIIVVESPLGTLGFNIIGGNETLNATFTDSSLDECWYNYNGTNISLQGCLSGVKNSTQFILEPNNLNMTIYANDTSGGENSTFITWNYLSLQLNQTFEESITEGESNSFAILLDVLSGSSLDSAVFTYNGTNYSTSIIFSSGLYLVTSTLVSPTVEANTNFTFNFNIVVDGISHATALTNQTVLNSLFDICGGASNDTLLNMSLFDEGTLLSLIGDIEISASIISKSSGVSIGNVNKTFENVNSGSICFSPVSAYSLYFLDAEIRYVSDGYAAEFYHIQKADMANFPVNLSLFDLNLNDSTDFSVTYKNNAFIFTEGAIIQLQRKYIGQDVYEVVEAPVTGDGGQAVLHIDLNTHKYRASVVKDGELLDFFDNIVFSCENELSGECTHTLDGTVNPNNDIPIEDLTDFSYAVSIDEENQTVTVLFAVPSGTPSTINVVLEQIDMFGNLTSCNTTIITSAGSITCGYVDTIEKSILELSISKDGIELVVLSFVNDPVLDMDGMNFFFVFIFLISLVGMAIASPEWMILISVMVLMISGMMLLLQGMSLVMGLGAIAWVIVAAAIIIMKMSKQEDR